MNRDDIIRMAQECQLIGMRPHLDGIYEEALQRFAALVAAHEREACAKVCEEKKSKYEDRASRLENQRDINPEVARIAEMTCDFIATAIRARGEA